MNPAVLKFHLGVSRLFQKWIAQSIIGALLCKKKLYSKFIATQESRSSSFSIELVFHVSALYRHA